MYFAKWFWSKTSHAPHAHSIQKLWKVYWVRYRQACRLQVSVSFGDGTHKWLAPTATAVVHWSCGPSSYSHMRMQQLCHQICSTSLLLPSDSQGRTLLSEVEAIEVYIATRGQTESALWYALHNGRLTSSRFGEILHQRSTTNPRRLVRDIMGYGGHSRGAPPQIHWGRTMSRPHANFTWRIGKQLGKRWF